MSTKPSQISPWKEYKEVKQRSEVIILWYSMCLPPFLIPSLLGWDIWFVLVSGLQLKVTWVSFGPKHRKVGMNSPNTDFPAADCEGLMLRWQSKRIKEAWITESLNGEQPPGRVTQACNGLKCKCQHTAGSFGEANGLSWLEQASCSKTLSYILMK